MGFIKVGTEKSADIQLHYEDHGEGKPVVLIHGWPLSGRAWEPQVSALVEAGHRVITYDRRGFGKSSQPWDGYDYDTLASDLNTLLETLNLKDVTLVGFSMGGGEVVRYIAKYGSGRISQAVLAGAVPPYLYKTKDNPDGPMNDATIKEFQDNVKRDRLTFLDSFCTTFFKSGKNTDLVSKAQHDYHMAIASMASPKGTLDCITAFGKTDFRGDLKTIKVPTLVIHGDSDAIVPFEASGKLSHSSIPGAELALIKGGPHGLNLTHKKEFNEALIKFLAKK